MRDVCSPSKGLRAKTNQHASSARRTNPFRFRADQSCCGVVPKSPKGLNVLLIAESRQMAEPHCRHFRPCTARKTLEKLFFLTHVHERAPAACRREERGKSARALRWIDPETRWAHLDVVVCIAAGTTNLCFKNSPPHRTTSSSTKATRPLHDCKTNELFKRCAQGGHVR